MPISGDFWIKTAKSRGSIPLILVWAELVYAASTSLLFHLAVMEPQSLRESYFHFLNSITGYRYFHFSSLSPGRDGTSEPQGVLLPLPQLNHWLQVLPPLQLNHMLQLLSLPQLKHWLQVLPLPQLNHWLQVLPLPHLNHFLQVLPPP